MSPTGEEPDTPDQRPQGPAQSDADHDGSAHADGNDHAGSRTQADGSAQADGEDAVYHCDLCGSPMLDRHCKLLCLRCGYQRDCSDP